MDDFISSPKQKFIDAPKTEALKNPTRQSRIEIEELIVSRSFPEGQFTMPDKDTLILWNFDVGRSTLKKEHIAQINKFVRESILVMDLVQFYVVGHASKSGANQENNRLARERAIAVEIYLKKIGFSLTFPEGRGNSEPYASGTDGLALARNRRIEILKTDPVFKDDNVKAPKLIIPESEGRWKEVPKTSGFIRHLNFAFEAKSKPISLGTWQTGPFTIAAEIEGNFKLSINSPNDEIIFKNAISQDKGLNIAIEQKLKEGVKAKFTFQPKFNSNSVGLKAGVQYENFNVIAFEKVEVGLQSKLEFVYVSLDTPEFSFGQIEYRGAKATLIFKGILKFSIGPGKWLLEKLARFAAPAAAAELAAAKLAAAAAPAAVAAGVIVVVAVIIGGTIYSIEMAKDEGLRKARLLAYRDIFASTVAFQISNSPEEFYYRIKEWASKSEVSDMVNKTKEEANNAIRSLSDDQLKQKILEWKESYGRRKDGSEDLYFTSVRERMFFALGGYNFDDSVRSDMNLTLSQL